MQKTEIGSRWIGTDSQFRYHGEVIEGDYASKTWPREWQAVSRTVTDWVPIPLCESSVPSEES